MEVGSAERILLITTLVIKVLCISLKQSRDQYMIYLKIALSVLKETGA